MRDKINKSLLLKKYETAYELCVKKAMKKSPTIKSRKPSEINKKCIEKIDKMRSKNMRKKSNMKKSRNTLNKSGSNIMKSKNYKKVDFDIKDKKSFIVKSVPKKSLKTLNSYQQFVRDQSKKSTIKKLTPTKRLKEISKLWKKYKNN